MPLFAPGSRIAALRLCVQDETGKNLSGLNIVGPAKDEEFHDIDPPLATFDLTEECLSAAEFFSRLDLGEVSPFTSHAQSRDQLAIEFAENGLGKPVRRHTTELPTPFKNTPNKSISACLPSLDCAACWACARIFLQRPPKRFAFAAGNHDPDMSFRSSKSIAGAVALAVCLLGLICNSIWMHSLKNEAGSLMQEMHASGIAGLEAAATVALARLPKNPAEAVTTALAAGWELWIVWSRGREIKAALEVNATNLNTADRWQRIYGWGAAISGSIWIVLAWPLGQKRSAP